MNLPDEIWDSMCQIQDCQDPATRQTMMRQHRELKAKYIIDSQGRYETNPDGSFKMKNPHLQSLKKAEQV
jgi:hypothetical protein